MERQTQRPQSKATAQTPGDEPNLGTALLVVGGFILFAAVILALVISGAL